ncbi:hypothetical protein MPDQ_007158 [Monascus purpureus]|uniref:FAD-binding PCMH-type domain-containing protein n=1 Tax=Monascus purpureus TaxID=5098 RepID=A0A507QWQ2_MONPU|nr:hypothetical protein MPDQ_007158 [Monascus purpureus]
MLHRCVLAAVGGNSSLTAFPGDPFYHISAVRPYNLNFPVTPAAIASPVTRDQVAAVIKCAVDGGHKVQARSGGHSYGNYGLGGTNNAVVVDLQHFRQFSLDNSTYVATIGPGLTLDDISKLLHNDGRAITHGTCPQVGVGGHLTIGGLGPTSRQWGLSLDHVEEVEVVLANSSIVRASDTENSDLFFAVKGAASSFGVVTEFKVRTHPEPEQAVQYSFTFDFSSTSERAQLFKDWQTFISDTELTRNFTSSLVAFEGGAVITGIFFGSKAEFDKFRIQHCFPGQNPSYESVVVLDDWLGMLTSDAEDLILKASGGIPNWFYAKSLSFTPQSLIPSSVVDDLFRHFASADKGGAIWFVIFDLEGGAVNDHAVNSTAYPHRNTLFWMQSYAISPLHGTSNQTFDFLNGISNIIRSSLPANDLGAYPGYVDPFLDHAQTAYWGPNLQRLQEIKASFDPKDLFHNPQSVKAGN